MLGWSIDVTGLKPCFLGGGKTAGRIFRPSGCSKPPLPRLQGCIRGLWRD